MDVGDMSTDELKQVVHQDLGLIKTDSVDKDDDDITFCELTKNILQNTLVKIDDALQEH